MCGELVAIAGLARYDSQGLEDPFQLAAGFANRRTSANLSKASRLQAFSQLRRGGMLALLSEVVNCQTGGDKVLRERHEAVLTRVARVWRDHHQLAGQAARDVARSVREIAAIHRLVYPGYGPP